MAAADGALSRNVRDVLESVLENVQLFSKQIKGETAFSSMYTSTLCRSSVSCFDYSFCLLRACANSGNACRGHTTCEAKACGQKGILEHVWLVTHKPCCQLTC